ncbi:MAG: bifunctional phosphopantothenoylcysteine decarboxylase/phosphopantothenate--cysteine ligase CoaBC [Sulfolobales archaeon]|jgi:phosphopantothenoylcysteine decarboxylase/phosphopantothenate--cysteine ligase|nr:bifunctional phosphopantothenoylcysteine decarboxylase/phosphopantothenate--cysteine ligase CoaBC [Sulfolobales archaeon]MDT7905600.1 bifunctional phosphopantothenoylcysteine decarboxylase/phosphopantothenate--cysteine ligase CoaBC [Sulfolobales archaeon]
MHPSERIIGEISRELDGKRVLLGVTGSVAVYKSVDFARALMRRGARVTVIMTRDAERLVSKELFSWATGREAITELTWRLEHVTLEEEHDAFVIAPATANTIAKIANGIADTPVTATALNFLGDGKPIIVVPSMHKQMYVAMRGQIEKLRSMGVEVVEPILVRDVAHYPELDYLSDFTVSYLLRGKDLKGLRVLVTAGPTREYLDPVRFVSNPSSGTMGVAVANEALFRGADVVLIHGPLCTNHRPYSKTVRVETTSQMADEVERHVNAGYDVVILAGAPADYRFRTVAEAKLDSATQVPTVEFERTEKVSARARRPGVFLVGFAAETAKSDEELIDKAKRKKEKHGFDVIVANNAYRKDIAFASEYNEVIVITDSRVVKLEKDYKTIIARKILDIVKEELKGKGRV